MTPKEVWSLIEYKRPKHVNGIPEDQYYDMIKRRKELEAQGIEVL
jgi:hypothetical protein